MSLNRCRLRSPQVGLDNRLTYPCLGNDEFVGEIRAHEPNERRRSRPVLRDLGCGSSGLLTSPGATPPVGGLTMV